MRFQVLQHLLFIFGTWSDGKVSSPSTVTPGTCSCNTDSKRERCIVRMMFDTIEFFQYGATNICVSQNFSATIKREQANPNLSTKQHFEKFNEKCLRQRGTSSYDHLAVNNTNQCSTYKCCIQCGGCDVYRILNEKGPIVLQDKIDSITTFEAYYISAVCATTSSEQEAGSLTFYLRIEEEECTVTDENSTDTIKSVKFTNNTSFETITTTTVRPESDTKYRNSAAISTPNPFKPVTTKPAGVTAEAIVVRSSYNSEWPKTVTTKAHENASSKSLHKCNDSHSSCKHFATVALIWLLSYGLLV